MTAGMPHKKDEEESKDMDQEKTGVRIEEVEAPKPPQKEKDDATELLKAMAFAAVIALVIRSFLFEPFNIPSSSMFPTLLVGDYLFVKKWSYGYSRYSFPLDLIRFPGRIMEGDIVRGDVAVFRQPKRTGIDYIKRVIGLPGDKIQVKQGQLYLNGQPVPRDRIGTESYPDEDGVRVFVKYVETLPPDAKNPKGLKHYIYEISDDGELDNTPEFEVPEGYFFAMGDNRDRSLDSRVPRELGYVPMENMVGPAGFIFFSIDDIGDACVREGMLAAFRSTGCKLIEYPMAIRWKRLFKTVNAL
jgi:signal peptidase I